MKISAHPGTANWGERGEAHREMVQRLVENVAAHLFCHFEHPPTERIYVLHCPELGYPRTLGRADKTDDFVVLLSASAREWDRISYQAAHEFLHVAVGGLRCGANLWFEESLAELSSIFCLKRMSTTWPTHAPYENWREYAPALQHYGDELLKRAEHQLPAGATFTDWFCAHEPQLRADSCNRPLNGTIAVQLFPLFEAMPSHWESVRYLPDSDAPFDEYLVQWRDGCPPEHRAFVADIGQRFRNA